MSQTIFIVSLISILIILLASMSAFVIDKFEFFPPPSTDSWQYHAFRVLFRIMFVGLLLLSFFGFRDEPVSAPWLRFGVWLPLLIIGFGCATHLTTKLGWKNAFGQKDGLVVSGLYRWSRNPIYVASLAGMIGWGFFVNSPYVSIILLLWALMYLLAPFAEERWLERTYGEKFLAYKKGTSRFFGFPKV